MNIGAKDDTPEVLWNLASRLIGQVSIHAHRLVVEALGAVDAKRYHYAVLSALRQFGPLSQADLGRTSGIDRSDIVECMTELEMRGFVARTPDTTDRRRNVVTITAAGTWHLKQLDTIVARVQDELLAPLEEQERRLLVDLLQRILEHQSRK